MALTQSINSQAVNILLAKKLLDNIWVDVLHMPDKGVNEGFSTDTNAASARIVRQIAPGIKGRTYGATVNGAPGNSANVILPTSEEYVLDYTYMYDGNIDIPEVMEDMFPLGIVEAEGAAMGGEFAGQLNASTIAEQLCKALNAHAISGTGLVALPNTATATMYRDALISAMSKLTNGDTANGMKTFPKKFRQIIARPEFTGGMFQANNILVGGSNYAQELLANGRISPDTYTTNGNMYIGEFMSVPVYEAPDGEFTNAEEWLDTFTANNATALTAGALDNVKAIVCSSIGTLRGVCVGNRIKQIDSPTVVGIRLQPKMRWGVKTILAKSVVPIVHANFNAATVAAYANGAYTTELRVQSPGSRA